MQRKEYKVDTALDAVIARANDIKKALEALLYKLENEYDTINWPTFLDNYALISGHLAALSKVLGQSRMPTFHHLAVIPLALSPQPDEYLLEMTENRLPVFSHDIVPDYLRTRPDPEVEKRFTEVENNTADMSYETAQKHVAEYTKMIDHVLGIVRKAREDWEPEEMMTDSTQTYKAADTQMLASAVGIGRGLRVPPAGGGRMSSQVGRRGMLVSQFSGGGLLSEGDGSSRVAGKPPVKTNIKSKGQDYKDPFEIL